MVFWVTCAGTYPRQYICFILPDGNWTSIHLNAKLSQTPVFCRSRQRLLGQNLWSGLKLLGIKFAFFHSQHHLCFEYLGMFLVACWQNGTGKKFVKLALLAARKLSDCKVGMWETSHSAHGASTFGSYAPLEKVCCNFKQKPQRSDKARRRLLEL